ncbi:MAG: hypothetical protein AAGB19_04100 [Cyanobacteria bacterium P01_F01_bin.3]
MSEAETARKEAVTSGNKVWAEYRNTTDLFNKNLQEIDGLKEIISAQAETMSQLEHEVENASNAKGYRISVTEELPQMAKPFLLPNLFLTSRVMCSDTSMEFGNGQAMSL